VFWALFRDAVTGQAFVRPVPFEEVKEITTDPDDRFTVRYYRRDWTERPAGGSPTKRSAYHPDWRYAPTDRPATLKDPNGQETEIRWDAPLLHVKAGAFPHWRWGVPEVYAALDWARAYKEQLEDDATRSRSLARFAWKLTTSAGKTGVAAAKTRFGTTLGTGTETNPAPAPGSMFLGASGNDLDPIRIAGATLDPDHSRPARLMTSAALGIPDHFFDSDVGNFATAKTLDRPTELRFSERRQLWRDVFIGLIQWVIDADLAATRGLLSKALTEDARAVDCSWPDLLEPDVEARVGAVATAATLSGSQDAGTLPSELVSRMLMNALNVDDVDGELKKLEQERAERERKAAEIAKQTRQNGPGAPQPSEPGQEPSQPPNGPQTGAQEAKRDAAVTISDADLADAVAWWDERFKPLAGLLGTPKDGD
jgi:hypothetical protein